MNKRISFYSQSTNLLPPKPKISLRHLKLGIQELHKKYVLAPADKVANNVVVVWRLHYVNTLQQELSGTKAYKLQPLAEERSVVNDYICHSATSMLYVLLKTKTSFLRYIGYLKFIKDLTKHGLLQIQALVPPLNFLHY